MLPSTTVGFSIFHLISKGVLSGRRYMSLRTDQLSPFAGLLVSISGGWALQRDGQPMAASGLVEEHPNRDRRARETLSIGSRAHSLPTMTMRAVEIDMGARCRRIRIHKLLFPLPVGARASCVNDVLGGSTWVVACFFLQDKSLLIVAENGFSLGHQSHLGSWHLYWAPRRGGVTCPSGLFIGT